MAVIAPFIRFATGTIIGIAMAGVPITVAGIPFFARLVENYLCYVPRCITAAAARVSGGPPVQIILTAQL